MISLAVLFWMLVVLFAIIGFNRGWAKEMLVSFSVILSLFILNVLERNNLPVISNLVAIAAQDPKPLFWLRTILVIALVFFGYQSPNISKLAATNRFIREKLQDSLLGLFLGALNGYLVVGTLWHFLHVANYPFPDVIAAPTGTFLDAAEPLLALLPPTWLQGVTVYLAVAICFAFVLVVLI